MLRLRYRTQREANDIELTVDDDRLVHITIDAEAGETIDDREIDRQLHPDEARELAAALWHLADEAERGRG